MKKRIAKLRLNRETLRALDGSRLQKAAGGGTGSDCMCADSVDCPTRDPDVYSCTPDCANSISCLTWCQATVCPAC